MQHIKYLFTLLLAACTLCACTDDTPEQTKPTTDPVSCFGLVLNSGSYYSHIDGSLCRFRLVADTPAATETAAFAAANGRSLGATPNAMAQSPNGLGKLYIAVTDENRVEVCTITNLVAIAAIDIPQPRCVAAPASRALPAKEACVYVSSYDGTVRKIDCQTQRVVAQSEKVGDCLEGLAVVGDEVFVANSHTADYAYCNTVVRLRASDLARVGEIRVHTNPTQLAATDDGQLFVACAGDYAAEGAMVQRIKPDGTVQDIAPATMMAAYGQLLYLVNTPFGGAATYSVYDTAKGRLAKFIDGTELFSPSAIAVQPCVDDNPTQGDVFIASRNQDPDTGYPSYVADGYIEQYRADGTHVGRYRAGVEPVAIGFYAGF